MRARILSPPLLVAPRLLLGLVILLTTEIFSGASIQVGVWAPWTWLVTYWLYFAHFFLFTTLAVRTGRTSLGALYLWGVLFGLYESWITKVIWFGYAGDGKPIMGHLGPYGYAEISMVVLFHPVAAFLLPLAVACVLSRPLRRWFPDLAWITGRGRRARAFQACLVIMFGLVMAMNSGGPVRLVGSLAFVLTLMAGAYLLARPGLAGAPPPSIVVLGRTGLAVDVVYLVLLYVLSYRFIRPEGLPSAGVQALTLVFYGAALAGLWAYRPRTPAPSDSAPVAPGEPQRVLGVLAVIVGMALPLSFLAGSPLLLAPIVVIFAVWTPLGLGLTALAIGHGVRQRLQ